MLYPLSYGRLCSLVSYLVAPRFARLTPRSRSPRWRRREDLNLRSPVRGQLISSESHSAALARLLGFLRVPDPQAGPGTAAEHSVQSRCISCRIDVLLQLKPQDSNPAHYLCGKRAVLRFTVRRPASPEVSP